MSEAKKLDNGEVSDNEVNVTKTSNKKKIKRKTKEIRLKVKN